ncbi:hypothetical protein [Flagellimonas iocasae]|uniref:Uncharacterized protein n=1 Tax=Flagellimonas iocasae TaxID=2055905 RepID=A0ABW4XZU4_9FLAO
MVVLVFKLNQLLLLFFLSISLSLFFLKTKKRPLDNLIKISALFILIHIVIFPLFYLSQLKKDSKSFEFDNYIKNIEKDNALNDIRSNLKPNEIEKRLELIKELLSDGNENLYLKLSEIYNSNQIYRLNNFLFIGRINEFEKGPPGTGLKYERLIYIYNIDGIHKKDIVEYVGSVQDTIKGSLFNFLSLEKQILENKLSDFSSLNHEIEKQENFWTYSRILPYVINIFNTDNIKPKSRSANFLFFTHNFIVVVFIIGLLGSSLYSIINQKK